ncbi:MAG TPA: TonB-dependent receptor [Rhizomicrobium sp.]|nr:TonB-dependent receptor [Rhizomicrobium sp.]
MTTIKLARRMFGTAIFFAVLLPFVSKAADIESVVVTAAHVPEPVGNAAFSVMTLNADQLTGDHLDSALERVPGLSLFRRTTSISANPTTQGLSLRSIAPSGAGRALVLLDGVPVNDPFGGWVIWTVLPSEDIGSAEIVRGAGAGPYGAGALTGTILLSERDDQNGVAIADASAGNLGTYRAAASGGAAIGDANLFGSISGERSDGWIPVHERRGAADNHLWFDGGSASLRAQTMLDNDISASARISYYDQAQGAGLAGAQAKAHGVNASLTLAHTAAPIGWRVQAWMLNSGLSNTSVSVPAFPLPRAATTPANDQYATPALGYGTNAALLGASGNFRWEAGGDLRVNSGESRELFRFTGSDFAMNRRAGGKQIIAGLYGEGAYDTGDWLLTVGIRADYWATSQDHLVERVRATDAISNFHDYPGRSGVVPTARLGARYNFADQYLRAAAYAGFRAPTLNELYRPFRVGNNTTQANAALKPEKLYGAEIGWGGKAGAFTWNLTGFWNQLHDAIANRTLSSSLSGSIAQRQNIGDIDALGAEGDATYNMSDAFALRAAFSLTDARVHAPATPGLPSPNGKRPAQAPLATITAGAIWHPLEPLTLNADLRWESARFEDDQNTLRLGSAFVLDLKADWRLRDALSLYVAADNVANANVATAEANDGTFSYGQPRMLSVGLSYAP